MDGEWQRARGRQSHQTAAPDGQAQPRLSKLMTVFVVVVLVAAAFYVGTYTLWEKRDVLTTRK